jgi:hypothetical protein
VPAIWGLSKQQANYRPGERDGFRCRDCKFMFPAADKGGCRYVRGVIDGDSTCDEFKPRQPRTPSART